MFINRWKYFLIIIRHIEYNEQLTDKAVFNNLWQQLSEELNRIGPPSHSGAEWKKVWSDHKYNMKRQCKSLSELGSSRKGKFI